MLNNIKRLIQHPDRSFFLFGPRGVGKTTWLKQVLPQAVEVNLLRPELQIKLTAHPGELESLIEPDSNRWVWIDEIQKIPQLLDEVHRLIEDKGICFALSGSSARKLRRQGANLLGGRALTLNMEQFAVTELGEKYDLNTLLEFGLLPLVINYPRDARETLRTYVHTYIKEEIKEEGAVRKIEPFLRFLEIAGSFNGMQVNSSNIAREAFIPRASVDNYFAILVDTLVAHFLPAYTPSIKVREVQHPKFYWFDPGVARAAADQLNEPLSPEQAGRALETLVFHELRVYNEYSKQHRKLCYYQTSSGAEIDFIIELKKKTTSFPPEIICLEIKNSKKWRPEWCKPIFSLAETKKIKISAMYGIYRGKDILTYGNLKVLPIERFFHKLHAGEIF